MAFFNLALFQQHYKVTYLPRGLTAWVFYGICLLVVLIIPVVIGLAMENFWIENNFFYQTPIVHFTNRCALKVTTVRGRELLWTCNEGFNQEQLYGTPQGVLPFFSVYEDDRDANGQFSVVSFTISVPVGDVEQSVYAAGGITGDTAAMDAVASVTLLPEFVYRINHYLLRVNMTAAPLLHFVRGTPLDLTSTPPPSSSASFGPLCALTEADMEWHSTTRLINSPYVHYTRVYTSSPLEDRLRQAADIANLDNFARYYTSRNQSVVPRVFSQVEGGLSLLSRPPSFSAFAGNDVVASTTLSRGGSLWEDLDGLNSFTWKIYLRIPQARIFYVPSYAETLKWGWVQYFVIAYLIQWFMWWVRGLVVCLGLIETKAVYSTREVR